MGFEGFIANKHLTRRQRSGFVSLVSMISMGGVAIGVMALIVVMAVMSGFDRELKEKIVNVQPHLRVEQSNGVDRPDAVIEAIRKTGLPGIQTVAAYVEGQGILKSESNATGILVKGLDLQREDLAIYTQNLREGAFDLEDEIKIITEKRFFKETRTETRTGGILLGEGLARKLGVRAGDRVQMIAPFRDEKTEISLRKAENRIFIVRGIFRLGMNDFDSNLALISLPQAQEVYHLGGRVTGVSVRFLNVDDAERYKFLLRQRFYQDYFIRSWYDMNHNFFQALKVEKSVMTILLALIILVAAFNIVASLTMVVMEKTKDIGVLRALGATPGSIRRIFILEGFSIGLFGVLAGAGAGLALAYHLNPVSDFLKSTTGLEVFPSDIYLFDKIPAQVNSEDVMLTIVFALLAAIVAGLYPADRAARLHPVEALRYE